MRDYTTMTREEAESYLDELLYLAEREDRDMAWLAEVENELGQEVDGTWLDDDDVLHIEPEAYKDAAKQLGYLIDAVDNYIDLYEPMEEWQERIMREYRRSV